MSSLTNYEIKHPSEAKKSNLQAKDENNCLICRVMKIRHDRSDVVKWIFSSDKPIAEKRKLATLLTGIKFDDEIIEYLTDPSMKDFIFSE
ncbi:MAG: hypothetical protein HZR80_03160 [Candidatus Heimdallarchaeota archaeon]